MSGRPGQVPVEKIVEEVLKRKSELVNDANKIVSKQSQVWIDLAECFSNKIKPKSVHAMVCGNRHGLREVLLGEVPRVNIDVSIESNTSLFVESSDDHIFDKKEVVNFSINMTRRDFIKITDPTAKRKKTIPGKRPQLVERLIFIPYVWENYFSRKIWDTIAIRCGFQFKSHSLAKDGTSGTMNAYCHCGSQLVGILSSKDQDADIEVQFSLTPGTGLNCKNNYLREPSRQRVVEEINNIGVENYLTRTASKLMKDHDPKAPMVYSRNVLHTAKYQERAKHYLNDDPRLALEIMAATKHANRIHAIGLSPFYVHYWTAEQVQTYRRTVKCGGGVELAADASGFSIQKILRPFSNSSKPIFLYMFVIRSDAGQFSIAQMLSETHTTKALIAFFMNWLDVCHELPPAIVCDESRAFLNASVRVFCKCNNIEEYADLFHKDIRVIRVRVRIDAAHFLNKYRQLFKGFPRTRRVFWMGAIGQLIIVDCVKQAEEILEQIFIIANSEYNNCHCREAFVKLKAQITEYNDDDMLETVDEDRDCISDDNMEGNSNTPLIRHNYWYRWGQGIHNRCQQYFDTGDPDYNALYVQGVDFTKRLLRDLSLIPIWSCMFNSHFGESLAPATSSPVENEFNKFKHAIMRGQGKQTRVDILVDTHLDYLVGKFKLIGAEMNLQQNKAKNTQNVDEGIIDISSENSDVPNFTQSSTISSAVCEVVEPTVDTGVDSDNSVGPPCCVCGTEIFENAILACTKCGKNVHSVDCVDPFCEEVVCTNCQSDKENLGLEEIENWGGLATKVGRKKRKIVRQLKTPHHLPQKQTKNCAPCAAGFEMSAHECIKCHEKVHAIEECSYPFRGNDEQRICFNCNCNARSRECKRAKIVGQEASTTNCAGRKNLYLGGNKTYVRDCLNFGVGNRAMIPVMKNGSDPTLTSLKIKGRFISLTNTCAFDALLNIWLYIQADFPLIFDQLDCCQKWRDSLFKKLVTDITGREKINASDYNLRAQILNNICQTSRSVLQEKNSVINCTVSLPWLAQKLFEVVPSFIETSECTKCSKIIREFGIIAPGVPDNELKPSAVDLVEKYCGVLKGVSECPEKFCKSTGSVHRKLSDVGPIVMFEITNDTDSRQAIPLNEIPKKIKSPLTTELDLFLIGVSAYKAPVNSRRRTQSAIINGDGETGHYTSLIYRWAAKTWKEIDDINPENQRTGRKDSHKIVPRFIVYVNSGRQSI